MRFYDSTHRLGPGTSEIDWEIKFLSKSEILAVLRLQDYIKATADKKQWQQYNWMPDLKRTGWTLSYLYDE